ncbi:SAM-dependent methyltransferase [Magnetococcales bacterium HHB-1]
MPHTNKSDFISKYDRVILHQHTRDQYDGTGFYNVGDWRDHPENNAQACKALVARHIEAASLDRPDLTILDVGCGLGDTTRMIQQARPDSRVTGVNISPKQISEAMRRHPGLDFQVMNATKLTVPPGSLDRIIAVEAAFHFDPRTAFLASAHRSLAPDGRMVLTDMIFSSDSNLWGDWIPKVNRQMTLERYPAMCHQAGWTVESLDDITTDTWPHFCANLRAIGRHKAADQFEPCVLHYILVTLTPH